MSNTILTCKTIHLEICYNAFLPFFSVSTAEAANYASLLDKLLKLELQEIVGNLAAQHLYVNP